MIYAHINPEKLIKLSFEEDKRHITLLADGIFYGYRWRCESVTYDVDYFEYSFFIEGRKYVRHQYFSPEFTDVTGTAYRMIKEILHHFHGQDY